MQLAHHEFKRLAVVPAEYRKLTVRFGIVRRILIAHPFGRCVTRYFLYIVVCADDSLYTGYTTNPARRLAQHNSGKGSKYTRARRPVTLAYLEEKRSRKEALRREIQIKRMRRSDKLLLCGKYGVLSA